jgi:hypothetical protein
MMFSPASAAAAARQSARLRDRPLAGSDGGHASISIGACKVFLRGHVTIRTSERRRYFAASTL